VAFEDDIKPFFWVEHEGSWSTCLDVGEFLVDVFATREDEGFEGNGYDWGSLAQVFLDERMPQLAGVVKFDPEGSMFSAYSGDEAALRSFITAFRATCDDREQILDLFSRAELD